MSDYMPIGTMEQVDDLPFYVVGSEDAKISIILIYDVFGLHDNTKQFCDLLAKYGGYRVVMPDFFRGEPLTEEKMAGGKEAIVAWISRVGSFDVIFPDVQKIQKWLQAQDISQAGLVGFCWGAKIAVQTAGIVDRFFGATAMIHPSQVEIQDAENAQAPILAIPTKDDVDMTEYMRVLSRKPFGSNCEHYRFDDVHHGFAAARGDWNDEIIKKRATEAVQLTVRFFKKNLTI
ncbi:Alpha/Beta hydrolase protein [Syncephalastrum racemosum]|uniref:Alpha/Beta hydrolase protein n=1 Tax=Syncephalastrum racemosum TaxID=13706 RepID=A0A1X2HF26_SYNRA|nr:Alpha/Beta hydrolase protein [Syncephalastrum racemosum]